MITSLCNANEWCFLWFPFMTDIPLWPPLAGSHRRKSENPHKRDICSSPQWYCWKKSCTSWKKDYPFIPLFTRFMYPRWCRISSINSISDGIWHLYNKHTHTQVAISDSLWRQATSWQLHWPLTQPQACSMKLFAWVSKGFIEPETIAQEGT